MFGLGTSELLIILVIVMLVFGASRLPQLGRGLGEGMRSFKDALKGGGDDKAAHPTNNQQSKKEIDSQA
jgi:sec-independent protein translocase protein TatA